MAQALRARLQRRAGARPDGTAVRRRRQLLQPGQLSARAAADAARRGLRRHRRCGARALHGADPRVRPRLRHHQRARMGAATPSCPASRSASCSGAKASTPCSSRAGPGTAAPRRARPIPTAGSHRHERCGRRTAATPARRRRARRAAQAAAQALRARRRSTMPSRRIRIGGLERERSMLRWRSLLGRPPRHSNSLQIDVSLVDAALRRCRHRRLPARRAGTARRPDRSSRHRRALRLQALWSAVVDGCSASRPRRPARRRRPGSALLKRLARQDAGGGRELCRRAECRAAPPAGAWHHAFATGRRDAGQRACAGQRPGRGNAGAGRLASARRGHQGRGSPTQRPNPRRAPIRSRRAARNGRATSGPGPACWSTNWRARPCS